MTKNSQELSPPFTEPWTYEKLMALFAETDRKIDKRCKRLSEKTQEYQEIPSGVWRYEHLRRHGLPESQSLERDYGPVQRAVCDQSHRKQFGHYQ